MTARGGILTLAGYLNDFGISMFPSTYGGLAVNGGSITIYLTTLTSETEHAFESVTPAGALSFTATPHTWEFLLALQQVVDRYWRAVTAEGVELVGFGPSVRTGMLTLRVENPSPQTAIVLDSLFGAGNITITQGYPGQFTPAPPPG